MKGVLTMSEPAILLGIPILSLLFVHILPAMFLILVRAVARTGEMSNLIFEDLIKIYQFAVKVGL